MKLIDIPFPRFVQKDGKRYRLQEVCFAFDGRVVGIRVFDPTSSENSHVIIGEELQRVEVVGQNE